MVLKAIHGTVHGKTIELDRELGMPEGQEVEVQVTIVGTGTPAWGGGLHRAAGALADDPHWDTIMAEIQRARKRERRPQAP